MGNIDGETGAGVSIGGDVTGDIVLNSGSGFSVGGDVVGNVDLTDGAGFTITGQLGDSGGTRHTLTVDEIDGGTLSIGSVRDVDMTITDIKTGGLLKVVGDVYESSDLDIDTISAVCVKKNTEIVSLESTYTTSDVDVNLTVTADLPTNCVIDLGTTMANSITFSGIPPLTYYNVNGTLEMGGYSGGLSVFRRVGGEVLVQGDMTGSQFQFNNDIASGGLVSITGGCSGFINVMGNVAGSLSIGGSVTTTTGKITVTGSVSGPVSVGGNFNGPTFSVASVTSTGSLSVTGSVTHPTWVPLVRVTGNAAGDITIGATLDGDVKVDGDLSSADITVGGDFTDGTIDVDGLVTGDIHVAGDVDGSIDVGKLSRNGRILVDGMADGAITVDDGTLRTSFIHLNDGLGSSGSLVINDVSGGRHRWVPTVTFGSDGMSSRRVRSPV